MCEKDTHDILAYYDGGAEIGKNRAGKIKRNHFSLSQQVRSRYL